MDKQKENIVDAEYTVVETQPESPANSISEKEAAALQPIVERFMRSYAQKPAEMADETWLQGKLAEELPERSDEDIQHISREILDSVQAFDANLASVHEACEQGKTKEEWFRDKSQEAAIGMSVSQYGEYLSGIDQALAQSYENLEKAIHTQAGTISMNPNLDGFIAEQQTANSFNQQAALRNSPYRAEVLVPDGKAYGKNSVDIVIRDTRKPAQNIVRRYQMKFGKDGKATATMINKGDYRGQQTVVPKGQKQSVRNQVSPHKQVNDFIEAPDGTRSKSYSKEQMKRQQERVQQGQHLRKETWNSYNTRELAYHIGKEAALAGVVGAAVGTGFSLAAKIVQGKEIDGEEVIKTALITGADSGVKAAATGALKVGAEKGVIPVLQKVPVGGLASIACIGIENAKILYKFATGEISGIQALDYMGRTSVATVYGLAWSGAGAALGASLGSVVPVLGTFVGGVVGGLVGWVAGSTVGTAIYEGAKKIVSTAASVAKSVAKGIYSVGKSVVSAATSVVSSIVDFFF